VNVEREIKLRFESPDRARAAVIAIGAHPLRDRRLQDDQVFDWPDSRLRDARNLLRVRREAGAATLTFKGPPQPGTMKVREEIETTVGDGSNLITMLERLGLHVAFRYQKYRQEFRHEGAILAIDETPVGTYLEIEGDADRISKIATALGRTQADYVVASYRELFLRDREARGLSATHMVFEPQ
jgi:adenylate cyclase class 2